MLLAGVMFVGVTAVVKHVGRSVPAPQAAFIRFAIGTLFLLASAGRCVRRARITPRAWRLFALRGVAHSMAVTLWFYAMARIPMTDVTAMNYLSPVYVGLGAALLFGERLPRSAASPPSRWRSLGVAVDPAARGCARSRRATS